MRIGQALAAEVRHRVGLAPDNIIEDPVAEILKRDAKPEDIVIRANHPDRAVWFEHTLRLGQPSAGETVIGGETVKLIPIIVHGIDPCVVGAVKFVFQLQVIGRVRKDQVHRVRWQGAHRLDAIALNNAVFHDLRHPRLPEPVRGHHTNR